ncbi:MAG: hypothetical protein IPP91_02835 [Betaproteobacteria bacterium]|nr:hypothetical protein [Betaproteobacteria bacterium]
MTTSHLRTTHSLVHVRGAAMLAAALLASFACDVLAQVRSVTVKKNIEHVQTSATTVTQAPTTNGYGFGADIDGTNISSLPTPVLTGPINTAGLGSIHNGGKLVYVPGDSGWRWGLNGNDFGTSSLASLNSYFGSGTYTITVNGTPISLNLGGDAFPNAPVLTLTGGKWLNGKYVFDPALPLTITTGAFTAYGSHADDLICVGAADAATLPFSEIAPFGCEWGPQMKAQFHSAVPGTNFLTYTVPANTFVAGKEYVAIGSYSAIVDVRPNATLPGSLNAALYEVSTVVTLKAEAPVFPMVVTGSIGPTVSNITAAIQYRPQDVGTTGSVYAFAVAPATLVKGALAKDSFPPLGYAKLADGTKEDTAVACVLAQLNASGQLQAVSPSSLQAYVTGVLSSQGQAVNIINGVATANIGGATFYVGYGTGATSMLTSGINRGVVSVPGTRECKPQAPQTGWWWNSAEGGRGYSIEVAGNHIFYAAFLYDESGRSNWYVATGNTSLEGSFFTGDLLKVTGGQTLTGAYIAPTAPQSVGPFTLSFSDASNGTMIWPGGTVAIERFNIVPGGLAAAPQDNVPESGWWWNAAETGRGFFIEWQNGSADLAAYMYDEAGNPVWYLSLYPTPNPRTFSGNWWSYRNGQTLAGAYRPPNLPPDTVAPVTVQFDTTTTATMTLPNGRKLALTRFRF